MSSTDNFPAFDFPTSYTNIPEGLQDRPKWLTTLQDNYELTDWCLYGYVGSGDNLIGIGILFQKKDGLNMAILGVFQPGLNSVWNLSASFLVPLDFEPKTSTGSAPWSVEGKEFLNIQDGKGIKLEEGRCKLALVDGKFGEAGAKYQITGIVLMEDYDLQLNIEMTDPLGTFNTGYGPGSFLPNYLLEDQYKTLNSTYNGDLKEYLKESKLPFTNQGSYYFSAAIEVSKYEIAQIFNGKPEPTIKTQSGSDGYIWFDSVTQTFGDLDDLPKGASVSWHWITIPRIKKGVALSATKLVYSGDETLDLKEVSSGAVYSEGNLTGSHWNSRNITFINHPAVNGQVREFMLIMTGQQDFPDVSLTFTALPGNQTVLGPTEGNYLTTGTIGEDTITPADEIYAWCEISTDKGKNAKKHSRLSGFKKAAEKMKESQQQ